MKEILLCKYGEIVLKGANRAFFENLLCKELKFRADRHGEFSIYRAQSTIYIEPLNDGADIDGMLAATLKVFGIVGVSRAAVCAKDMEAIKALAREYIPLFLDGAKTFKCEAKRSDKSFPLSSPQISAEIGGEILSACPRLRVDVNQPDVVVRIEIREFGAYLHAGQYKGAGGMPLGSNGRGLLLLSGGIDSPVAGWMMAKRGVKIEALHFESAPYTSEQARDKVLDLAGIVAGWAGSIRVHVISLTRIQEELKRVCAEDYFTLLLRRCMMRLAEQAAKEFSCDALITGESVGQVASQTMEALNVTNAVVSMPVFRPCIGMDKEEIIQIARKIDTFATSILPYADCCTVFTPRHPRTRPELAKVEAEEALLDLNALLDEAWATMYHVNVRPDGTRSFWEK